jgi:hypothetical protein
MVGLIRSPARAGVRNLPLAYFIDISIYSETIAPGVVNTHFQIVVRDKASKHKPACELIEVQRRDVCAQHASQAQQ